jgi:ElaB/YqjD/DUF883 family membrane-anchored ribosome-binding protein
MSDDSKDDILIKIGELRGTINGHEKRLDQQHQDIIAIRSDIAEIKTGQSDARSFMMQCFADQNAMLMAEIHKLANASKDRAQPVRDFIQDRPYAAVGSAGVIVAIINWVAIQFGVTPQT